MKTLLLKILSKIPFFGIEEVAADESDSKKDLSHIRTSKGTMAYYGQSIPLTPSEARMVMYASVVFGTLIGWGILLPILAYIDHRMGR